MQALHNFCDNGLLLSGMLWAHFLSCLEITVLVSCTINFDNAWLVPHTELACALQHHTHVVVRTGGGELWGREGRPRVCAISCREGKQGQEADSNSKQIAAAHWPCPRQIPIPEPAAQQPGAQRCSRSNTAPVILRAASHRYTCTAYLRIHPGRKHP